MRLRRAGRFPPCSRAARRVRAHSRKAQDTLADATAYASEAIVDFGGKQGEALYYQINYTLTDVPDDAAYFHAQFRRVNPLPYKEDYTVVDNIVGKGHYVGTYLAWQTNNSGWWGEGEIKFFMDVDTSFPTICGTGEEDYFCGSYGYDDGRDEK